MEKKVSEVKPILFDLFGSPVYSYPLLMGLGWGVGYNVARSYWEKNNLSVKELNIFFVLNFFMGWIGAKVFFLIFSAPNNIAEYSREVNFWLGGGFVFYGGLVFSLIASLLFLFFRKSISLSSLGLLTPAICIGHAIGRLGCFLAGCCYGDKCDLFFGVEFAGHSRHPVQLYETAGLLVLFFFLKKLLDQGNRKIESLIAYLCGYSTLRFTLEFFRGDGVRGHHHGLSTSQWVSIILVIFSLYLAFMKKKTAL
jgi:phosphatidylglycerol:prolipoprotein diacylglycerol transferase